jgi:hypothetical protein
VTTGCFSNAKHKTRKKVLSVYVDSDAVHLYHAGKACGWHAGVLLAAPTVKRGGVEAGQACKSFSKFK